MDIMLDKLEKNIGYFFVNKKLLLQALTHPSYNEHDRSKPDNQRLEFLGDSILSAILSETLFKSFPNEDEGALSRMRAVFIRGISLAQVAKEREIHKNLLMSQSELKNKGNERNSTLEDALEALIGAIFLDGGIINAKKCVLHWFGDLSQKLSAEQPFYNPKGQIQEYFHDNTRSDKIRYQLTKEEGPPHKKNFEVDLIVGKKTLGTGLGSTKKEAEEKAAKQALIYLNSKK